MLKFFLDKMRDRSGPLKQFRLVVGDIVEELIDIAAHYIHPQRFNANIPAKSPTPENPTEEVRTTSSSAINIAAKRKKTPLQQASLGNLDMFPELMPALDSPANQKKQEFKVLAILWDANRRGKGDLSAMDVADHGNEIGLVIRHENVRKVIRMQLSGYVESMQNRKKGTSIQQYRITPKGINYFAQKYLQQSTSNEF